MTHHALVTGAANQIGYFLLPRLLEQHYSVKALIRQPSQKNSEQITWVTGDLDNPASWLPQVQGVEILFHLAHLSLATSVLTALEPGKLQRVVAFSSTSIHTRRQSSSAIDQKVAKDIAHDERTFIEACKKRGVAWTLFRPTLIYGCNKDKNVTVMANFIRRFGVFPLVGAGTGLRQPVHADDLAKACIDVLNVPATENKIYELAGGETLSYRSMVKKVFQATGKKCRIIKISPSLFRLLLTTVKILPKYRYLSPQLADRFSQNYCFDYSAAQHDFGYAPRPFTLD